MTDLSGPMLRLAQLRKLDARCLDCGEGMAVTGRCYACGSSNLRLIPHGSDGWTHCLGGGGSAVARKGTPRPRTSVTTPDKPAVEATSPHPGTFGL